MNETSSLKHLFIAMKSGPMVWVKVWEQLKLTKACIAKREENKISEALAIKISGSFGW